MKRIKDDIAEFDSNPDAKKKMKKTSASAFSTMKQKLKKIYPEYEAAINEELTKNEEEESSES